MITLARLFASSTLWANIGLQLLSALGRRYGIDVPWEAAAAAGGAYALKETGRYIGTMPIERLPDRRPTP